MKTVGEILKKTRLEKQINLEQAEIATKIRKKFLQALEENDFSKLPSYPSGCGFLKNYAEFLGLPSKHILAIFRRDFAAPKTASKSLSAGFEERIKWNPKLTFIAGAIIFLIGLCFWLGYQYFSLKRAPFLEIISPSEGEQVSGEEIEVVGRTQPDVLLTINGIPILLSPNGEFHYKVDIFAGENKITIVAKNKVGKQTKIERTIFRLDK